MLAARLLGRLASYQLIDLAFSLRPQHEYLVADGRRITRGQALAAIRALAAGLQRLGVGPGDRVAVLLPACPEAVYAHFLPAFMGTLHMPLNPLLGEHELRHILRDSGARVVITTRTWYGQDYTALLARLLPDLPALRTVVVRDLGAGDGSVFWSLDEVMAPGQPLRRTPARPADAVTLSYTSGTTGLPKGVVHTRAQNWALAKPALNRRLASSPLQCLLLPFAPYQFPGMFAITAALVAGGKVVLMERFDPQQALEQIQRERVTQIGGSPTMLRWLLLSPGQERYDLSSVQRVTLSTEPCSLELARALHERLGCSLENLYGSSEARIISWTAPTDPWERVASTVGRPAPGVEVRIVDDQRQPVPTGEQGEVAVRSAQMMRGYYRDSVATARVLDSDGWFYTGDLGTLDEEGMLRLAGRKDDLILRAGQNVYPAEVERYLESHPKVRRAGVVGAPGPLGSVAIWAFVERQPGATLTTQELRDYCRGQIAPFKIPESVRFVERLPVTVSNKLQRYQLRAWAAQDAHVLFEGIADDATALV